MRTYRLGNRSCRGAAFKRAMFALAVLLLAVTAGLLYLAARSALTLQTAWPLALIALICVLVLPLGAWRMCAALGSYRLTLSEDRLTQSMRGANDVTVGRDEVTEITETPGTSLVVTPTTLLVVRTGKRRRYVMVFDGLEDYADLRARLAEWRDIKVLPARSALSAALLQVAILFPAACIMATFWSSNPFVVVPAASAGIAAAVAGLWMMQRSMHAPAWAKIASWALLPVAAALVVRMAMICGLIGKG
jgi:hypothetical protein